MCKINLVNEFKAMMRYSRDNALSSHERLLWTALLYIANDRAVYSPESNEYLWPSDFIPISIGEINSFTTFDKRAISSTRNILKQRGVIDFIPGNGNKKNPCYKLNYLTDGYKNAPDTVPGNVPDYVPGNVPDTVPDTVPDSVPKKQVSGTKSGTKMHPYYNNNIYNNNSKIKTVRAQRYTQRTYTEDQLAGSSDALMEEARALAN